LCEAAITSASSRIDYRDGIASFGGPAIAAVRPWFEEAQLAAFAVRVVDAAWSLEPEMAQEAMAEAAEVAVGKARLDAQEILARHGDAPKSWPRLAARHRTVSYMGDYPYLATELRQRSPNPWLVLEADAPDFIDTIVIGWDCQSVKTLLTRIASAPRPPRFLPQEAWVALLLLGDDWWLDEPARLNRVADEGHPIADIRDAWPADFPWPGTDPAPSLGGHGGGPALDGESPLRRLGYQISGLDRDERWRILANDAVPRLGLHDVAFYISGFVVLRKLQPGGRERFAHAITEWEYDLDRLKRTYYGRSDGRFPWPRTEP
jgi:hypothetical protein